MLWGSGNAYIKISNYFPFANGFQKGITKV